MSSSNGERGFRSRVASALRPKKSSRTLRKASRQPSISSHHAPPEVPVAPLQAHREQYKDVHRELDTQLGERRDFTELLHVLGREDPFDSDSASAQTEPDTRPQGERLVGSLSPELWDLISRYLSPLDSARLAASCWVLYNRLAPRPFHVLDHSANYGAKIEFLLDMEPKLPDHLLCFPCARYHRRLDPGRERLLPTDTQASRPVFLCPNARNVLHPPPRLQMAPGRGLPFTFAQLVMREHRYGSRYGISPDTIDKRWAHEKWQHSSRFIVRGGRLLMRVTSQAHAAPTMTPSAKRNLLFDRADYMPYWSVCAHWKHGDMTAIAKCALDHVPYEAAGGGLVRVEARMKGGIDGIKGRQGSAGGFGSPTSQCGKCKPIRRCAECPSEYLVQIKFVEDKKIGQYRPRDRSNPPPPTWGYAIVITRWSDLGEGISPLGGEWAACAGSGIEAYDSFAALQKRSLAGTFESSITGDTVPSQRILSLNPKRRRRDDPSDDSWY